MTPPATTVVVPTVGRASLSACCLALATQSVPVEAPVVLVDDRPSGDDLAARLAEELGADHGLDLRVVRAGGGGPARARNIGWRHARTPWVSFLDDDVVPDGDWYATLLQDLEKSEAAGAAGSTGRVRVPLPADRAPTDWERGTAGLETSRWITADLSYRRTALSAVGGFDERFPRAFREDADLALRVLATEGDIVDGDRRITHPVRPADDWVSLRQQAGNADDYLMRALHGPDWPERAEAPVGRRRRHVAITLAGLAGLAGVASRRPLLAATGVVGWLAGTGELARARIAPGPRDAAEVRRMLLTSAAIPAAATYHSLRGAVAHRRATPWRGLPELVLLDRDGTLVHDVPYNGDPARVRPVDGAREALDRLRAEGVRLAIVSNQSGVARGLLTRADVDAVNARVVELLGPFEAVHVCTHGPDDGCDCRKPAPGLLQRACAEAGVPPARTVMIGDIGADVEAATAAGVSPILVPTAETLPAEVAAAPRVARSLPEAVLLVLGGAW
jgi:histidinol-phosphate phosphatase family protein